MVSQRQSGFKSHIHLKCYGAGSHYSKLVAVNRVQGGVGWPLLNSCRGCCRWVETPERLPGRQKAGQKHERPKRRMAAEQLWW